MKFYLVQDSQGDIVQIFTNEDESIEYENEWNDECDDFFECFRYEIELNPIDYLTALKAIMRDKTVINTQGYREYGSNINMKNNYYILEGFNYD